MTDLAELKRLGRAEELVALERTAMRVRTSYGSGAIVWRRWGTGTPVLLLHGGSGSWNHWLRTIPELVRDRSVWAPDLPGLGESDLPPIPITTDDYCALLADGFNQIMALREPFDLVTFSMGGEFAVPFANLCRDRIRRVILVGSNIAQPFTREHAPMRPYRNAACGMERDAIIKENFRTVMLHDETAIDELALAMQHDNLGRRRLGAKNMLPRAPLCETVKKLHGAIDLHTINGSRDFILPSPPEAQATALAALRPNGLSQTIEGGSHWVMYDRPREFNQCLRRALCA